MSGKQHEKLCKTLINAFPSKDSLKRMLSLKLDKNLDAVALGDNLREIVFKLIETAEAENWVEDLIKAALEDNRGNQLLNEVANELGVIVPENNLQTVYSLLDKREMDEAFDALDKGVKLTNQIFDRTKIE